MSKTGTPVVLRCRRSANGESGASGARWRGGAARPGRPIKADRAPDSGWSRRALALVGRPKKRSAFGNRGLYFCCRLWACRGPDGRADEGSSPTGKRRQEEGAKGRRRSNGARSEGSDRRDGRRGRQRRGRRTNRRRHADAGTTNRPREDAARTEPPTRSNAAATTTTKHGRKDEAKLNASGPRETCGAASEQRRRDRRPERARRWRRQTGGGQRAGVGRKFAAAVPMAVG